MSSARGALPLLGQVPESDARPRWALAAKGFRPFFLLAAAFAAAIVPLWLLVLGSVVRPTAYLDATSWHAHEMVFGFAVAVIAGFLLTAVGNWTQRETAVGAPLMGLCLLWVLGRVVMLAAARLPRGVAALVDVSLLPVLVVVLARPILAAKNRRNLVMLAILLALSGMNVVVHLDALGLVGSGAGRHACLVAIDLVILVILIMSGRVFPMFTRNATGATSIRSIPWLDALTIAGMALVAIEDVVVPDGIVVAAMSGFVGVAAAARALHWGARRSARHPLLWVLHAGYAWIPIGLVARVLAAVIPAIPRSLATHALTVGAIATISLGMMARVALGHSGRALVAPKPMAWAFAAITSAAVARVVLPVVAPSSYFPALVVAGVLWTIAFSIFLAVYTPILSRPRLDGKAG